MSSQHPNSGHSLGTRQMGRKRPAKLFHKKSRTGCQRCRSRRVKCDEGKPTCHNCTRLELTCTYDRLRIDHPQSSDISASSKSEASNEPRAIFDPPESESRRKTELQLFYQYITETGPSIAIDSISHNLWVTILCRASFRSNAVLYSLYLTSALHTANKAENTNKEDAEETCRTYLNMALREHNKDIADLNVDNVDFVCLASSLLRVYGLVKLQNRPLQPYMPPVEWLRITGTSVAVFRKARRLAPQNNPQSVALTIMAAVSHFLDDQHKDSYGEVFLHLMQRRDSHELVEEWDTETQTAYRCTLNFLGSVWRCVRSGETHAGISRRLIAFPLLLDRRFVDMVEEQRPRALVILAHYFAMLAMLRGFWWIGDTGPREVHAIADVVPAEWRSLLSWPLQVMDEQPAFAPA